MNRKIGFSTIGLVLLVLSFSIAPASAYIGGTKSSSEYEVYYNCSGMTTVSSYMQFEHPFKVTDSSFGNNSFSAQLNVGVGKSSTSGDSLFLQVTLLDDGNSVTEGLNWFTAHGSSGTEGTAFNHQFANGDQIELGLDNSGDTFYATAIVLNSAGSTIYSSIGGLSYTNSSYSTPIIFSAYSGVYGLASSNATWTYSGSYLVSAFISSGVNSGNSYFSGTTGGTCSSQYITTSTAEASPGLTYQSITTNSNHLYYDFA